MKIICITTSRNSMKCNNAELRTLALLICQKYMYSQLHPLVSQQEYLVEGIDSSVFLSKVMLSLDSSPGGYYGRLPARTFR